MKLKHFHSQSFSIKGEQLEVGSNHFAELNYQLVDSSKSEKAIEFGETKEFFGLHLKSNMQVENSMKFRVSTEAINFLFVHSGTIESLDKNGKSETILKSTECNMLLTPFSQDLIEINPIGGKIDISLIGMNSASLEEILNLNCEEHISIQKRFQNAELRLLAKNQQFNFLTSYLLSQLFDIQESTAFKHLDFNSKVYDILAQFFKQLSQESFCKHAEDCQLARIKPLIEARKILEASMAAPPSLTQLSKLIGLNEFDLKKRFKEEYGTTVFGYLGDVRMQYALNLLNKTDKTVGEISSLVGYKNPQHFSTAFKKKFGLNPSKLTKGDDPAQR